MAEVLVDLGHRWSEPLHKTASRTDTHDMGFMIQPSMRRRWELLHDEKALEAVITAAQSLYTRWNGVVGAIRSWDELVQVGVTIDSMEDDFLVIIDSMMNLDLLYYAAAWTGQAELADAATRHATTLLTSNLRAEEAAKGRRSGSYNGTLFSTVHVVNFCPKTGAIKERRTAQGYAAESTWARGQAWAIFGYAQTYLWTQDVTFLDAACGLAEYFLLRLETAPDVVDVTVPGKAGTVGRHVPLWDFDAPTEAHETDAGPLRDSSAGVIAANGMVILGQALIGCGRQSLGTYFLEAANVIVKDTLELCLATEKLGMVYDDEHRKITFRAVAQERGDAVGSGHGNGDGRSVFEAILRHATANHNSRDRKRYWDHGLVYADYYLIEFGNRLLERGLT